MEEEDSTGSPENGFVHIQPVVVDQVERLEQDDGVVVTGVEDTVQDEPHGARPVEDAVPDEFVDCPDDLVSSEARSPGSAIRARQQPFGNDTKTEKEILPQDDEEERKALIKEISNLHHQLKALSNQNSPTDEYDGGFPNDHLISETREGGEKSLLHEMVNDCAKFIESSVNERSQAEGTIRELNAALHMKDKEIEDLMVRVNGQSASHDEVNLRSDDVSSFEATADRILSSIAITIGDSELFDTSLSGKLSHLEKNTSFLLEKYHQFLSEVEMLGHCLAEVKPDFQMQNDIESVFFSVREELVMLKRKELELNNRSTQFEYQHGQMMEQLDKNRETVELLNSEIGKLIAEVEQEKTRYSNTKEKLSMAVTKGKALVQQRDSLKQMVAAKTSELERCLNELQGKSAALEAAESRNAELTQTEAFSISLQEALSQRDMVLRKCAEILSLGLPEAAQFPDFESQVSWLVESYNLAKDQFIKMQDENAATREAASVEIDRLTASLIAESQEKYHLNEELKDLTCKYEGSVEEKKQTVSASESSPMDKEVLEKAQRLLYVCDLDSKIYEKILELEIDNRSNEMVKISDELRLFKDEKDSLQITLQRSEEKASLLREKLSMAVKKGKGLVQERENLKQQITEKNAQIEALMADFQKQGSTLCDFRDQVAKLESERDQIGQYLAQSNTVLQETIETIDGININIPLDINEPVEKVKWFATYLIECQISKAQVEQELGDVKDEASQLTSRLTEALTSMKSLEDDLSVSENNVSQLLEEKKDFEFLKTQAEQEVENFKEEVETLNIKLVESLKTSKSLDDKLASSEKTIGLLTEEKNNLEIAQCHVEDELRTQTSKFQEALSLAENRLSVIMSEKEEAQVSIVATKTELQKVMGEVSDHVSNLDEANMTINSLREAMSQLKTNVSEFSQENEKALDRRTLLESEIEKLKEEAEQEISTLKTELSACRQELEEKHDKWGQELSGLCGNLKTMLKDESLLSLFQQSFEKKVESLKEIDHLVKDVKDSFDSQLLQDYPAIEERFQSPTVLPASFDDEFNAEESEGIDYVGKILDNLNKKNQILVDHFGSFSTLFDDMIASLFKKIEAIRNSMPLVVQKTKALHESIIEQQVSVEENMSITVEELQAELVKTHSMYDKSKEVIEEYLSAKENMAATIQELQGDLEKTRSMYDQIKEESDAFQRRSLKLENVLEASENTCNEITSKLEDYQAKEDKYNEIKREMSAQSISHASEKEKMSATIKELEDELEKTRSMYDQIREENDAFQGRVLKLENELEASVNTCNEVSLKLEDYQAKEDEWNEAKQEFSAQSMSHISAKEGMSATIEELKSELERTGSMHNQVKEENDAFQRRVLELENELETSGNAYNEMNSKLEDYQAKEDSWNKSKQELAAQSISYVAAKENMSATIEELQSELEKTRSMYDQVKEENDALQRSVLKLETELEASGNTYKEMSSRLEDYQAKENNWNESKQELSAQSILHVTAKEKMSATIEELQGELEKTRSMYDQIKEENDGFQRRVLMLENELESYGNTYNEMSSKLEDYRAKVDKLNESNRELSAQSIASVKDRGDAEVALLSASQIKDLFDKIDEIAIPFPNLLVGDVQPQDSDPAKKLFYVVDSVNELLDQLTLLTYAKEDLQSTVSKQALEVDHLKGEFKDGLQNIIQKLGGEESLGLKKPADTMGLLLVLERIIQGIVLDRENSRFKLVETQKVVEDLSSKVKLLEDFIQNRTGGSDTIQERGVFEAPSLSARSEISEIDDQVPVGKSGLPVVPSAAQMRSLRKGSNEQLAITIDSESDRLLDKGKTGEDKGHVFKSLHTTGLVPVQGKMIADRLDGIWVSGGQALMRQPRARLGVIAYWLVLHLWLLGTIL